MCDVIRQGLYETNLLDEMLNLFHNLL